MDPLERLQSANERNQVENTQKASDLIRAYFDKKLKDRKAKTQSAEGALFAPDAELGDDVLGSMAGGYGFSQGASVESELDFDEDLLDFSDEEEEQEQSGGHSGFAFEGDDLEELEEGEWQDYQAEPPPPPEAPSAPSPSPPEPVAVAPSPPPSPAPQAPPQTPPPPAPVGQTSVPVPTVPILEEEGLRPAVAAYLDYQEQEESEVDPVVARVTNPMIFGGPPGPAWSRLQNLLGRFGLGVLRLCSQEKVRVYVVPAGCELSLHPDVEAAFPDEPVSGAVYLPESRMVLIEANCLLKIPRHFQPVLFYFAHAFDHVLGETSFASLKSAAVKASFQACLEGLSGREFSDALAEVSPVRYFAQACEAYLGEGASIDPLWTREDLYDFDRSMYDYVEYLLGRVNGNR